MALLSLLWPDATGSSYLELPTEKLAEVLRLDPEDSLVNLPLFVATCDGEIGEESVWQEAIMSLAYIQISADHRFMYFLILVMASWDILADACPVQLCW